MSRFGDGDADGAMPIELFRANVDRALKGKRGQRALRELRRALLALPEPKLIKGALCDVTYADDDEDQERPQPAGFCAIGALAFMKRQEKGEELTKILEALRQNPEDDYCENELETIQEGERQGLVNCLAYEFAWTNDEGLNQWREEITPEERFKRMLAWIDERILPEVAA